MSGENAMRATTIPRPGGGAEPSIRMKSSVNSWTVCEMLATFAHTPAHLFGLNQDLRRGHRLRIVGRFRRIIGHGHRSYAWREMPRCWIQTDPLPDVAGCAGLGRRHAGVWSFVRQGDGASHPKRGYGLRRSQLKGDDARRPGPDGRS